jgi:ABC-type phosphate transport system substrate-binding protein
MKSLIFSASLAFATLMTFAETSFAAPQACSSLLKLNKDGTTLSATAAGPVVYVTGSSAVKPVLAALGPAMFADPTTPYTIVYLSAGSCVGVSAMIAGTPMATNTTTNASYWDANSLTIASTTKTDKEESCTLDNGQLADLGISDVFPTTCGFAQQGLPQGLKDFQGPIQSMTFAVPLNSSQSTISWEAAYLTFGLANLAPWVDNNFIFRRNEKSGTQTMIAAAINVDATRWTGKDMGGSQQVYNALTALVAQSDIDKAIGIMAADFSSKSGVKQLAYQHVGQRCGYKPDIVGLDKRNTREGRYAIWGPLHLITQVDGSGLASKPSARALIAFVTGTQPPPLGVDLIRLEANIHVVPPCAMGVQRTSEMGPIASFTPPRRCGCAFDQAATGQTKCTACANNSQCSGNQSCNFGYCEDP